MSPVRLGVEKGSSGLTVPPAVMVALCFSNRSIFRSRLDVSITLMTNVMITITVKLTTENWTRAFSFKILISYPLTPHTGSVVLDWPRAPPSWRPRCSSPPPLLFSAPGDRGWPALADRPPSSGLDLVSCKGLLRSSRKPEEAELRSQMRRSPNRLPPVSLPELLRCWGGTQQLKRQS